MKLSPPQVTCSRSTPSLRPPRSRRLVTRQPARPNSAAAFLSPGGDEGALASAKDTSGANELIVERVTVSSPGYQVGGLAVISPGDKVYRQGETIRPFTIHVTGGPATVTLNGLPEGLAYGDGNVTGTLPGNATAGAYVVTVTASDGASSDSVEFGIAVLEVDRGTLGADLASMTWLLALAAGLLLILFFAWRRRRKKQPQAA